MGVSHRLENKVSPFCDFGRGNDILYHYSAHSGYNYIGGRAVVKPAQTGRKHGFYHIRKAVFGNILFSAFKRTSIYIGGYRTTYFPRKAEIHGKNCVVGSNVYYKVAAHKLGCCGKTRIGLLKIWHNAPLKVFPR